MIIMNGLLPGFIIFTTYSHSLLRTLSNKNLHLLFRLLINILYSLVISIMAGFFPTLISLLFFSNYADPKILSSLFILLMFPSIIFACMCLIAVLNFNNHKFSMPRVIYIFIVTLLQANPRRHYKHALGFIIVSFLILYLLSSIFTIYFISPSIQTERIINNVMFFCAIFSIILSIILYSYSAINPILRLYRKFVLWSILLVIIVSYTSAQIYARLDQPFNQQYGIDMVLLIGGLIFTITGVIDKGEELLAKLSAIQGSKINQNWKRYYKSHNISVLLNRFTITINRVLEYLKNNNKFPNIVRPLIMVLLMTVFWVLSTRLVDVIIDFDFSNSFIQHLNLEHQEFLNKITPLLVLLLVILYLIVQYVRRFEKLNWNYRGIGFFLIFLVTLMFCSMVNNTFFNQVFITEGVGFLLKITAFGFVVFGVLRIVQRFYEWLKK